MQEEMTRAIQRALERFLPVYETDDTLHESGTLTVPALSVLYMTLRLWRKWTYYVKEVYVDPAPDVYYTWSIDGRWELEGNEHKFSCPLIVLNNYTVVLTIENRGTSDRILDWYIDGWVRR